MDFGIKGKKAIVCAASKGLGKGCAQALAREGVDVTICARGAEALNATAKELGSAGVKVTPVVCDVTTEAGARRCSPPARTPTSSSTTRRPAAGRLQGLRLDDWAAVGAT
jgi:3-oxoacyl-[acyl-carrier protein] reductase